MQDLTLTARETTAFHGLMETLFPVEEPFTIERWGLEVAAAFATLVEAPRAGMLLTFDAEPRYIGWEVSPDAFSDYERNYREIDEALQINQSTGLEAISTRSIMQATGTDRTGYERSASYEWAARWGLTWGLACLGEHSATHYTGVMAYAEGESGLGGVRDIAIAQLCQRPVKGAIQAVRSLSAIRGDLTRLVDTMADGAEIYDARGRLAYRNVALRATLARESQSPLLEGQLQVLAHRLRRRVAGDEMRPGLAPEGRTVSIGAARYELWGTVVTGLAISGGPWVVVGVRSPHPRLMSQPELIQTFGLTPREAQVTALLARGASNAYIVRALDVRPSTARRHTERVLRKLGLHSRSAVPAKVMRDAKPTGSPQPRTRG